MKIINITKRKAITPHRDITVAKNHNFFANSILTHNCNLPARNVVITGVHRGINEVDELDLVQMCGRAGRYGIDDAGFVYMIVPANSKEQWKSTLSNPKPVTSCLKQLEILAFHILSEIYTKNIINEKDVYAWYNRSLASVQKIDINETEIAHVIQDLINMRMIKKRTMGNILSVTNIGIVSALMYYSPYDIYDWYRNFEQLYSNKLTSDKYLSWAIADIKSNKISYIPKNMVTHVDDLKKMLNNSKIDTSYTDFSSIKTVIAAMHCFTGSDPTDATIKSAMHNFQFDSARMITALEMIDTTYSKWGFDWKSIGLKILYGVGEEMLDLLRIEGVGKVRAEKLYSMGLTDVSSVSKAIVNDLQPAFTLKLAKEIIEKAKQLNRG